MEPSRNIILTVPLFSTDYAKVNREIAEWNRRARAAFSGLEAVLNDFSVAIYGAIPGTATASTFGTVKTNLTVVNPVVYLTTTVDILIADLQAQIDAIGNEPAPYQSFPVAASTWTWNHGSGFRMAGVQAFDLSWNLMTSDIQETTVNQIVATHLYNATGYLMAR